MHLTDRRAADQGRRLDLNMLRFAEMPLISRRAPENEEQRARRLEMPVPASACQTIPKALIPAKSARALDARELARRKEIAEAKRAATDLARRKKEIAEAFKNGPISANQLAELRGICNQSGNMQMRDWLKRGLVRLLEVRPVQVKGCAAGTLVTRQVQFFEAIV
jgi:hypothetical protein